MLKKFFITILFIQFAVSAASAQEIEFPLSSNPVIKEYLLNNPVQQNSGLRVSQSSVVLPFEDDFSSQGLFPNTQLWMDSDAYVNQTMGDNPVTIGVLTLDGINKYGDPHDSNSTSITPVICDYLTSRPIDMSAVTAADSIYFSFYYQPQGMGDEPEDGDSIVLEFYSFNGVDSNWVQIWNANGRPNSPFEEVRIRVDNGIYFWSGFQFRFYNYGTPNGNRDHWNLDYVKLRTETFDQKLFEITLLNPIQSYLTEFTAMPYSHYKSEVLNGNNPVKSSVIDTIRAYAISGGSSASLRSVITDGMGTTLYNQLGSPGLPSFSQYTDTALTFAIPSVVFPSTGADFANFFIEHQMDAPASGRPTNDTSRMTQRFHNYYAYDDGTAESATGVHVAYTSYAYQFDVKQSDSLLGVSIFFNPWGKNVHQDLFTLNLWSSITVGSNSSVLVHNSIDNKPANNGSINGFVDYYFDTAQWVNAGTNYIGIVQSSINEIGIGVDHNTDAHNKMFLNFNNQWVQSTINGSWMMRPIFGKKITIGVNEIATHDSHFDVFPNPANDNVTILLSTNENGAGIEVSIYNILGEKVISGIKNLNAEIQFDVHALEAGVYFVRLVDETNSYSEVKKLIIQH